MHRCQCTQFSQGNAVVAADIEHDHAGLSHGAHSLRHRCVALVDKAGINRGIAIIDTRKHLKGFDLEVGVIITHHG